MASEIDDLLHVRVVEIREQLLPVHREWRESLLGLGQSKHPRLHQRVDGIAPDGAAPGPLTVRSFNRLAGETRRAQILLHVVSMPCSVPRGGATRLGLSLALIAVAAVGPSAAMARPNTGGPSIDLAQDSSGSREPTVVVHTYDNLLGGGHWRLPTSSGAVHVWTPAGYDVLTAGIVLFAHGYGTSADASWKQARLASQFRASRRNALFIVPDGPQRDGEPLRWPALDKLLRAVATRGCMRLPTGPVIIISHSSGFRTLASWIGDPRVHEAILLDGFHGRERALASWLAQAPGRKMLIVAARSRAMADHWVSTLPGARQLAYVPRYPGELIPEERAAPLLYLRSQYAHSEMINRQVVIPLVLALVRLAPTRAALSTRTSRRRAGLVSG